jgi:hypothetical protein
VGIAERDEVAQPVPSQPQLLLKVVQEFKLRLAQLQVIPEGEQRVQFKGKLEAIGNFLVSCSPEILPLLEQAKEEVNRPRFTL